MSLFRLSIAYEENYLFPHTLRVRIPDGTGKYYAMRYHFQHYQDMMDWSQFYYMAFFKDRASIVKFHEKMRSDFFDKFPDGVRVYFTMPMGTPFPYDIRQRWGGIGRAQSPQD